jgi:molybdenum cofactor cytidylyltransferase
MAHPDAGFGLRWPVLPAIVLAAGRSTRMGRPKALLPAPDGRPFVARVHRALAGGGAGPVVVVTGEDHDAIVAALEADAPPAPPLFARNPDPSRGQLSSLWVGMDAVLGPGSEGFMMTLVDVPLVTPAIVRRVLEEWQLTRAPIVRPAIGSRHGHPVIFDRALIAELRGASLEEGAKAVVRAYEAEILNVAVDDEGCLTDVDTPDDYEALRKSNPEPQTPDPASQRGVETYD